MNTFRTFLKFAFFIFLMFLLDIFIPMEAAFYATWAFAGLIGIERLFRGILKLQDPDWVDFFLIIAGALFGFITFFFAEYLGDLETETKPATPQEKIVQ